MNKLFLKIFIFVTLILGLINIPSINASTIEGTSDNGILITEWTHQLYENDGYYGWGYLGSSPAIADFGSDVGYGDANLEIVTGSDAYGYYESDIGSYVSGAWHMFSYDGTAIWAKNTQSDEARGDVAIADINNDGYLEIIGGTTSGETVEVMDRFGNFLWTFPDPPHAGNFMWPGGPAVDDVDSTVDGLEVIIGNRPYGKVFAFDGDNSDGNNDGITMPTGWPWTGTEGTDWDVLWTYDLGGQIYATAAIGDVDNDGLKEVVIGSTNGKLVSLNAKTGALEWTFSTSGGIYSSAALADFDGDGDLEVVVGSTNGNIYFIDGDENNSGTIDAREYTSYATGGAVYSSAAIGDVDNAGDLETLIGSNDGYLRSFDYNPALNTVALNWGSNLGGGLYSSPSLANRNACQEYRIEWGMFRNNPQRTGFYGPTSNDLDVYIGSTNGNLYLVDGNTGTIIDSFFTGYWYGQPNEIRTSPSIADVDNDGKLEVFFYEWGSEDTFWAVEDTKLATCKIEVELDIKPQSCPNPLNTNSKGVLPVAILGVENLDVTTIDLASIRLEGVAPIRSSFEDVSTPVVNREDDCDCTTEGLDGYEDLTLKFDTQELVNSLGPINDGDVLVLTITGNLLDGTPIEGLDCIRILSKKKGK